MTEALQLELNTSYQALRNVVPDNDVSIEQENQRLQQENSRLQQELDLLKRECADMERQLTLASYRRVQGLRAQRRHSGSPTGFIAMVFGGIGDHGVGSADPLFSIRQVCCLVLRS